MLVKYAKLYLEFAKQNIKVMLEYRTDFIIGALSTFVSQLTGIIFIWLIFENIGNIKGWSFYEISFIYGLLTMSKGINHVFFDNLWVLGVQYIKEGKFDLLLLRPISSLFHLLANKIQQDGFGSLIVGIILTVVSINKIGIHMGIVDILLLIIFVLSGSGIFFAINLITATTSFWFIESTPFIWSVFMTNDFALYPMDIYNKYIKILLTWIIPYGFASFYPASYFLNKGYAQLSLLSPIVAIILCIIASRVWKFGLSHYESVGS